MLIPRQPPPKSHSPVVKPNIRTNSNELNPYQLANTPSSLLKMPTKYKIPTYQASSTRLDSLESQFSSVPHHGYKASSYASSINMIKDEVKQPLGNARGTYRGTLNTQISTYEQGYKVLSAMQTNTGNKEDLRSSVRKNKGLQQRDTTDSPVDVKESMKASKSQVLKTTALNTLAKNTKANFDRHHATGLAPIDEGRLKKLNMTSIKEFSDKYTFKYLQGYGNQLLEKCISLLSTENDPFVLENLFPGQYTMYIALDPTISSLDVTKANTKMTSSTLHEQFDSLNNPTSPASNGGFLPSIRSKRLDNLHLETDSQGPASRSSIYNGSRFSGISVIGSKKYKTLPRMDAETFKESLYFYKDFAHKSVLMVIEAAYKEANMQVGFVELLWDESKQGSICISKYFVQKVYRKMGMMIPVTVKAIDHLFKTYKVDRLTMEMLPGNDALHDPLTLVGFKYERIFYRDQQKWQNYVLKKKDFYQCFQDIVGLPENYTLETTTFRSVPRGMW